MEDPASKNEDLNKKLIVQAEEGRQNIKKYFDDFYATHVLNAKSGSEKEAVDENKEDGGTVSNSETKDSISTDNEVMENKIDQVENDSKSNENENKILPAEKENTESKLDDSEKNSRSEEKENTIMPGTKENMESKHDNDKENNAKSEVNKTVSSSEVNGNIESKVVEEEKGKGEIKENDKTEKVDSINESNVQGESSKSTDAKDIQNKEGDIQLPNKNTADEKIDIKESSRNELNTAPERKHVDSTNNEQEMAGTVDAAKGDKSVEEIKDTKKKHRWTVTSNWKLK